MTQQERNVEIVNMLGWIKKGNLYAPSENDFFTGELTFHSDWSYLMDAVEFIENKLKESYNVDIVNKNQCEIVKNGDKYICGHGFDTINHSKQEAVFIAVSNFAKMFNNKEL
jgi:hypothetical protein